MDEVHSTEEIQQIAQEILEDALAGLDPREWRGSKAKIVYNDPANWVEACRRATIGIDVRTDDDRVACVFLMIENLNGKRRVPQPDGGMIISLLEAIQGQIDVISIGHPRRVRLQELHNYHEAIVAGLIGEFSKSADYQLHDANHATSDWNKTISQYLASRETLNDALVNQGRLDGKIDRFELMIERILQLADELPDDQERLRWRITVWFNYHIYRLLIDALLGLWDRPADSYLIRDLSEQLVVPDSLKATFAGSDQGYRALSALANGDYREAADIAAEDIPDIQDPEWVALALLVRVHALHLAGQPEQAQEPLNQLRAMTWGCHLAQAIARQLGYFK